MTQTLKHLLFAAAAGLATLTACATSAQLKPPSDDQPDKPAPDEQPETDARTVELLEQIEKAAAGMKTLKSRVKYTRTQGLTGDLQERYGDFYYAAQTEQEPTRFAVLFDRVVLYEAKKKARPMETWYIFDGNWLLERDHDTKQAVRRELVPEGAERPDELNLGDGSLPIPMKLEAEKVLKRYHVARNPDVVSDHDEDLELIHLTLTPRRGDGNLDLWFDAKTLQLHKLVTTEDADEIELIFALPKPNEPIKDAVFDTGLPSEDDGWDVQEVPIDGGAGEQ